MISETSCSLRAADEVSPPPRCPTRLQKEKYRRAVTQNYPLITVTEPLILHSEINPHSFFTVTTVTRQQFIVIKLVPEINGIFYSDEQSQTPCCESEEKPAISPLHALLQLSLLADLWELFLVVLPHLALLGSAPRVVFDALDFLLPGFHQLVIALAKFLFLKHHRKGEDLNPLLIHCTINNLSFYVLPVIS